MTIAEKRGDALKTITEAMAYARARGYTVRRRATLGAKACCPLGAVGLAHGLMVRWSGLSKKQREDVTNKTMALLGFTGEADSGEFAAGFDWPHGTGHDSEAWQLGKHVALSMVPSPRDRSVEHDEASEDASEHEEHEVSL
jgi:hypothetical protein